jgi:endonuclease/exonuclease/phosphatase family metal-dependent hydrolase
VVKLSGVLIAAGAALGIFGTSATGPGSIAPDPAPPPLTLRFVTFYLLHGGIFSEVTGDDETLEGRLRLAVEGLRALDADVVALQEASIGRRRGNVAARLATALGYRHVHAPAATRPLNSEHLHRAVASVLGFTEGPALLSRLPILRWQAYDLPPCGRPFDARVLVFAELATPAGPLAAFSVHTSGNACHARSVADVVRANAGPLPAVVMGDFNADHASPAVQLLTREAGFVDAFARTNPGARGFTDGQALEAAQPTASHRIDYIFVAPGREVAGRVVRSRVVLREPRGTGRVRWPSDHYGVLAEIALDPPRRHVARSVSATPGTDRRPPGRRTESGRR